jgi:formylglycine-generating enzyme required for sulfatase activity
VTGGTFSRSYDGVTSGYTNASDTAAVADFRLDRYEITVGRFRQFVAAVAAGWSPAPGSGTHAHLRGGAGLVDASGAYGAEPGWDATWSAGLPASAAAWGAATALACSASGATWTAAPGANERRPINCIDWYQATAFCTWDGGFLPTEAEWELAATGGDPERPFPWGSDAADATRATSCPARPCGVPTDVGAHSPTGDGLFGHADLAGNASEATLDVWTDALPASCEDCGTTVDGLVDHAERGGSFRDGDADLRTSARRPRPELNQSWAGARCARAPR